MNTSLVQEEQYLGVTRSGSVVILTPGLLTSVRHIETARLLGVYIKYIVCNLLSVGDKMI